MFALTSLANVRFWHLADILELPMNVRFRA